MRYLFLFFFISFTSNASQLLKPEAFSWEELVELQKDVINNFDDHYLSPQCFSTLESYNGLKRSLTIQTILWKTYVWETYDMPDKYNCIVLYENYEKSNQSHKVLTIEESKSLLSASKGFKFKEKGLYEFSNHINTYNQSTYKSLNRSKTNVDVDYNNKNVFVSDEYTSVKFPLTSAREIGNTVNTQVEKNGYVLSVDHNQTFLYPYNNIVLTQSEHAACNQFGEWSAFMVQWNVSVTNAHNIYTGCQFASFLQQQVSAHLDQNVRLTHYPIMVAANAQVANNYLLNPIAGNNQDYGAIRYYQSFFNPFYIGLTTNLGFQKGDRIRNIGYPMQSVPNNLGMKEDFADYTPLIGGGYNLPQVVFDKRPNNRVWPGQSGSPSFRNNESNAFGMVTLEIIGTDGLGVINGFTPNQVTDILSWMSWNPTGIISYPNNPVQNSTYNLVEVPEFLATVTPINNYRMDGTIEESNKNLEDLITWTSSIDGEFGTGGSVTEEELKTSLSGGWHFITTKIDSNGEQAESNVFINIIKPSGQFTSSGFCIVDLGSSQTNSCQLNITWSVSNTPATSVVWNETTNTEFATGNNGGKSYTATTNTTTFKLYPSDEKIILLDTINAQAKVPTGELTVPSAQCSLQPSPIAPDGTMRNPKATPPGCGTELSWSNVQWASPSIFYRPATGGPWQLLYQVPCQLNGDVCAGSIHTDDYATPELISTSGYEFKLVQFNDANSGNLTAPFTVTAKRFADAYEYDDGWFDLPDNLYNDLDERLLANGGTISNRVELGQTHANHNFHRPAAYDSGIDIDAFDISTSSMSVTPATQVNAKVFNMASGLDVDFEVLCVGSKRTSINAEYKVGVWELPESPTVSNTSGSGFRQITFNSVKFRDYYDGKNNYVAGFICEFNQVRVRRTTGTPGENLTYDFVASLTDQGNNPILDSVAALDPYTYKIELLGENFGTNPSVSLRDNVSGSQPIVYSSDWFHNLGTHVSTHINAGKNFIRFPILEASRQATFKINGLCFKVISGTDESPEHCYKIPSRSIKPNFMGEQLQSYIPVNATPQDIDNDAYTVKTNGNLMKLWGNSWKKLPTNYTVTPNTELEVEFKSTLTEPEFSGVGFIHNGQSNLSSTRFWQFYGTQSWGKQEHNDYNSGSGYKTYRIKIGDTFTGQISHMVFVTDNDNQQAGQNVVFRLPTLMEGSGSSPSGTLTSTSPCSLTGTNTYCDVTLSVQKQDTPYSCIWKTAPTLQLVSCTSADSWNTNWQWTNVNGHTMQLRAHDTTPQSDPGWPGNMQTLFNAAPLLDEEVVVAQPAGSNASGSLTSNSPCTLIGTNTYCNVTLSVQKQDTPYSCIWKTAPTLQLFSCTSADSWNANWQWTNVNGHTMQLRAHDSSPQNDPGWPGNMQTLFNAAPLLDEEVVVAQPAGSNASGTLSSNSPCTLTGTNTRCDVTLSVQKQDTPYSCIWTSAPSIQLVSCTSANSWDTNWQWTNVNGHTMQLRAHDTTPQNDPGWPGNMLTLFNAAQLLDEEVVIAQPAGSNATGSMTTTSPCTLTGSNTRCDVTIDVQKQGTPYSCIWKTSPTLQLVSCYAADSWTTNWQWTNTGGHTMQLRAHDSTPQNDPGWPGNMQTLFNAAPLLDEKVVIAVQ